MTISKQLLNFFIIILNFFLEISSLSFFFGRNVFNYFLVERTQIYSSLGFFSYFNNKLLLYSRPNLPPGTGWDCSWDSWSWLQTWHEQEGHENRQNASCAVTHSSCTNTKGTFHTGLNYQIICSVSGVGGCGERISKKVIIMENIESSWNILMVINFKILQTK